MNSDPHKYFLDFPMAHLTAYFFSTKLFLDFYSDNTVDIEIKEIGRRRIPSRYLSNSHFLPDFSCTSDFLASSHTSACKSTAPIPYLDQSVLM